MNVLEARVVLRDRGVVDVVDLALRFLTKHGVAYAKLALLVLPPWFLFTWWVAWVTGSWGWAWTWALLGAPLAGAPFTVLASRLLFESRVEIAEVVRTSSSALLRLLMVRLLEGLGVALAGLAFLLPSVWFLALFLFTNEVVVLEKARVPGALARMQRLLSGSSGDAILAVLFLLALHIVAVFLGDLVGRAVLEDVLEIAAPPSIIDARGSVLGMAGFWLFVPFAVTCRFLLYVNVRTRNEGWDVQTRFAAIAARAQET